MREVQELGRVIVRNPLPELTLILTMTVADVQAHDPAAEKGEILRIEQDSLAALMSADTIFLDQVWAEEYTLNTPNGGVLQREDYLTLIRSHQLELESLVPLEMHVRIHGTTAEVTGRILAKGMVGGREIAKGVDSYRTVYTKRGGRWLQLATYSAR